MVKPQSWYKIRAKHDDDEGGHAEILIYGEIGLDWFGDGISAESLVLELNELDVATLDVRINSVGGQVFEGLAIFNALVRHPAQVTTHIDGLAASIASIVALAGDERRIAENAFMMVHNPWGFAAGDANEMRRMADGLDELAGSLLDTYVAKSGNSEKVVRGWMDAEKWFSASAALDAGLVDEVADSMDIAARFDLSKFGNVPNEVRAWVTDTEIRPAVSSTDSGWIHKPEDLTRTRSPALGCNGRTLRQLQTLPRRSSGAVGVHRDCTQQRGDSGAGASRSSDMSELQELERLRHAGRA